MDRRLFGFGLTVGWLWLFFLNGPVFAAVIKGWPVNPDGCFQFFMLCTSLAYLLIGGRAGRRLSLPAKNLRGLYGAAAALMAASSGIISLPFIFPVDFISRHHWVIYLLLAGGAAGSAVMLLAWLKAFLHVSAQTFGLAYAGGVVIASILLFGGAILDVRAGIGVVALLPLAALPLILPYERPGSQTRDDPVSSSKISAGQPFPPKLVLLIVLFYIAGGLMYKLVGAQYAFAGFFWVSNVAYMLVVVPAGLALFYFPDLDLRLLSRPVLPLLAAGFLLFPLLTDGSRIASFLLLQAGFALFDMYALLLIVHIARGCSRPLSALGRGMFWITFAMFGGDLAFTVLSASLPLNRPTDTLSIVAGLVTLLGAFVFQEKRQTFIGRETEGETVSAPPAVAASDAAGPRTADYISIKQRYNLTAKETEILLLLRKGRNNPFIREKLNISPNTLKFHLRNIYQKFGVTNRQELLGLFEREDGCD